MLENIYYTYKEYRNIQRRTARRSKQYEQWKYFVMKRDHFRCAECGAKDNLNVHHIALYSENTGKRIKKDNGITLCHECHTKKHPWMYSSVIIRKASKSADGLRPSGAATQRPDQPSNGLTDKTVTFLGECHATQNTTTGSGKQQRHNGVEAAR